jgi:hypothetical protein
MVKYTEDDYFAAASAQDLWGTQGPDSRPVFEEDACRFCDASEYLFENLWDEAMEIACAGVPLKFQLPCMDGSDIALLAAQIGCEKAGFVT